MPKRKGGPRVVRHVVTRYELPDGTRVVKDTPGAIKRTTTTESYYGEIPRERGQRPERVPLGTANEKEAWRLLDELLSRRAREAVGLNNPLIRHAVRPIEEHLADWESHLRDEGRTSEKQVKQLLSRMRTLVGLAEWQRLPQIDRGSASAALAKLSTGRSAHMPNQYAGRGPTTRNHYLRHLKQFVRWAVGDQRLERNPVDVIQPVEVTSKRHPRRAPSDDDVMKLMAYCDGPTAKRICGLSGPHRALAYRVAMSTGFRAKEVRSLTRASFDLDKGEVTCDQAFTKNRERATMPIPPWLVAEMRAHFDAGGGCWERWPHDWPGRPLKLDQKAAGVEHRTVEGFFDFHALRVWYITFAAHQPDISPKTLQTIARHKDPKLTLGIYAKSRQGEDRKIVDRLPRPGAKPTEADQPDGETQG